MKKLILSYLILSICLILGGCDANNAKSQISVNTNNKTTVSENKSTSNTEPTNLKQTSENENLTDPIFGITTDTLPYNEEGFKKLTDALAAFKGKRKIVIRINIDPNEKVDKKLDTLSYDEYVRLIKDDLEHYSNSIDKLKPYGAVMVNLNDSHGLYFYKSVKAYRQKLKAYLEKLGEKVDIWEIGNEVNGDWAGWRTNDKTGEILEDNGKKKVWTDKVKELKDKINLVRGQIAGAYQEIVDYKNKYPNNKTPKTSLTLYYFGMNETKACRNKPDYEINDWINSPIIEPLRNKLDYVFISVYEDDNGSKNCPFIPQGKDEQITTFETSLNELSNFFNSDNTKFGFGEFAPQCKSCKRCDKGEECSDFSLCEKCLQDVNSYIPKYYSDYGKKIKSKNFTGGFFYWYFYQDVVKQKSCYDKKGNLTIESCPTLKQLINAYDNF